MRLVETETEVSRVLDLAEDWGVPLEAVEDRMPHSGLRRCATARLKEPISWPLKPLPVRD